MSYIISVPVHYQQNPIKKGQNCPAAGTEWQDEGIDAFFKGY